MKIVSVNVKVVKRARLYWSFVKIWSFASFHPIPKRRSSILIRRGESVLLVSCGLTMGCPNTCISKVIERHWARPSLDKSIYIFTLLASTSEMTGVYIWTRDAKDPTDGTWMRRTASPLSRLHCCPPQHRQKHTRSEMRSTGGSQEHAGPKSEDQPFHPSNRHWSTCPVSRATPYTKATAHRWTAKTWEHHLEKAPGTTLRQPFHPRKEKNLH